MPKNSSKKPIQNELLDIFVSAVVVAKANTEKLTNYVQQLSDTLSGNYTNYEVIIVDNGVSETEVEELTKLLMTIPCIRIIRLSSSFKYDTALFAGLEVSIGDYVCTIDPNIDPIGSLPELVSRNFSKDVIQGVSNLPVATSKMSQMGRKLFYWYNRKYIGIDIPVNATYFASYSRKAVNALTQTSRSQHHIRHLARRVGYAYDTFLYSPIKHPSGDKKLKRGVIEAVEIAVSYSTHPLRFVTWLGLIAGIVNVVYAVYVVMLNVLNQQVAEGWTTTSLQLSLMFFILFMILIIISEYVGRILTESYKDPQYYVTDELTSTIALADVKKRNVTK